MVRRVNQASQLLAFTVRRQYRSIGWGNANLQCGGELSVLISWMWAPACWTTVVIIPLLSDQSAKLEFEVQHLTTLFLIGIAIRLIKWLFPMGSIQKNLVCWREDSVSLVGCFSEVFPGSTTKVKSHRNWFYLDTRENFCLWECFLNTYVFTAETPPQTIQKCKW